MIHGDATAAALAAVLDEEEAAAAVGLEACRLAGRRHGRARLGRHGFRPQAPGPAARRGAVAEAASAAPATGSAARGTPPTWLTLHLWLPNQTRMPRPKPSALTGTAELNAMLERVAPDILALLTDGVLCTRTAIIEALAGRHDGEDVVLALIRLAVTERVIESGGRYRLVQETALDAG